MVLVEGEEDWDGESPNNNKGRCLAVNSDYVDKVQHDQPRETDLHVPYPPELQVQVEPERRAEYSHGCDEIVPFCVRLLESSDPEFYSKFAA